MHENTTYFGMTILKSFHFQLKYMATFLWPTSPPHSRRKWCPSWLTIQKAAARSQQFRSWLGQGGRAVPKPGSASKEPHRAPWHAASERKGKPRVSTGYPERSLYEGFSSAHASGCICSGASSRSHTLGEKGRGCCPRPSPTRQLGRAQGSAAPAGVTPASLQLNEHLLQRPARLAGTARVSARLRAEKWIYSTIASRAKPFCTLTRRRREYLGKFDEVWDRFLFSERCRHTQCWCGAHEALRGQPRPRKPPFQREAEHRKVTGG